MAEFLELHVSGVPVTLRAGAIHVLIPNVKDNCTKLVIEESNVPLDFDEPYDEVKELLRRAGCRVINNDMGGESDG